MRFYSFLLAISIMVLSFSGLTFANEKAHWTLDEGSGTIAYDNTGSGRENTMIDTYYLIDEGNLCLFKVYRSHD